MSREFKVKYADFKQNHPNATTKPNSYNPEDKTIVVLLPDIEDGVVVHRQVQDYVSPYFPEISFEHVNNKTSYMRMFYDNLSAERMEKLAKYMEKWGYKDWFRIPTLNNSKPEI